MESPPSPWLLLPPWLRGAAGAKLMGDAAPAQARGADKCLTIPIGHRRAKVQMLRNAIGIDPQHVGILFCFQMKNVVLCGNHKKHPFSLFYIEKKSVSMRFWMTGRKRCAIVVDNLWRSKL